jgi:hypothetical protein
MNHINRQTVDDIKQEVESCISESNNLEHCRNNIWKILNEKYLKDEILDFRLNINGLNTSERREFNLQKLLDQIDPLSQPPINKFDVTLKLPNELEYISLNIVQMI